jgi:alpha-beta hydrolase superfamily lysophospholipase
VPAEKTGAPAFQQFLKSELLPAVEGRYRGDPERRVLVGQSRGGSFVLYSAFTEPDLFWGRIASNPAFDPGRERFFGQPAGATRPGLGLVVTSGSRDRAPLREAALQWFHAWEKRSDAPWAIKAHTIEGGTHAADIANAYRVGMLWLFGRDAPRN